jgi:hypothetical protein
MRIRATCTNCGRDFYFFQLYNADPVENDRCPHCSTHLGIPGVRYLAQNADEVAAELVSTLQRIAMGNPRFTVHTDTLLPVVTTALDVLAERPTPGRADRDEVDHVDGVDGQPVSVPRWWQRRAA